MICSLLFCCYLSTCLFHFRRAHTLTVLFVLVSVLIYVAVFEPVRDDTSYNTKRYRPLFNRQTPLGVVLCEPYKVPDSNYSETSDHEQFGLRTNFLNTKRLG
jgi:hypothetical protein